MNNTLKVAKMQVDAAGVSTEGAMAFDSIDDVIVMLETNLEGMHVGMMLSSGQDMTFTIEATHDGSFLRLKISNLKSFDDLHALTNVTMKYL